MSPKWMQRFMDMAVHVSEWSKDPSRKIGAVIVDPNTRQILSLGYNGFPQGVEDDARLDDKAAKRKLVVHAEMNAIYNAAKNGVNIEGAWMFVSGLPSCHDCAKGIKQTGISRVINVYPQPGSHWHESHQDAIEIIGEENITYMED